MDWIHLVLDRNKWWAVACTLVHSFLFLSIVTVEIGCHLAQHVEKEVCSCLFHGNELLWPLILTDLDLTQDHRRLSSNCTVRFILACIVQTATVSLRRHYHVSECEDCPCLLLCDSLYSDRSKAIILIYHHTPSVVRTSLDLGAGIYCEKLIPFYQSTQRHVPEFWSWVALLYMSRTQYFGHFIVLKSYTTSQRFVGFPACFFSLEILQPKDSATNTGRQKNLKHHVLLYFTDPWRCSSSS